MPIRVPTPTAQAYAWHRSCLCGHRPPTFDDEVQCGWFRTRFVTNGPWVPGCIWLEREIDPETMELASDEVFRAIVEENDWDPVKAWNRLNGGPISKAAYDALVVQRQTDERMLATHVAYVPPKAIRPTKRTGVMR